QRRVVLYDWLDGRHFSNRIGRKGGHLIGRLIGRLHDHGQRFRFPPGASRPKMLDILDSVPWRLPEKGILREMRDKAQSVMEKFANVPRQVVHFDVHLGNLKIHRDEVSVFDFDDCLMAWPGLDIAQSMFYLRRSIHAEELERGLWEGLGKPLESYGLDREEFEVLVAGRALLLACDLLGNRNAELQKLAPQYVANTEVRIKNYLETGRFDTRLTAPG
ncbi:MAG TPA: phosphotransferase, partial [Fimbriimonadaceae bacterium]|nr:phosphotransferase [Fimbriimonadaceae bacterium]